MDLAKVLSLHEENQRISNPLCQLKRHLKIFRNSRAKVLTLRLRLTALLHAHMQITDSEVPRE
jgi:hypothetical protein